MIAYASNTQGKRNLSALRDSNWRLLISPGKQKDPQPGFKFAIDNGAWSCFKQNIPFDADGFTSIVEIHGGVADFIVIPDIVEGGMDSFDFSVSWLDRLKHFRRLLFAVQDGMEVESVGSLLERHPHVGIFLGGSTSWKLKTMFSWGMVAHAFRRYYHVGRVNSMRRIKLCQEAGADSFDGTSATMYSDSLPKLERARKQRHLLPIGSGAENFSRGTAQ